MTDSKMYKTPKLQVIETAVDSREVGPERRRMPRVNLTTEQFRLADNGKVFSVADISSRGMALRILDRQDFILFPVGHPFKGTLNIQREKHAISAKVRHLGGDLVGCEFQSLSPEVSRWLDESLDPSVLGALLKPLPASEPNCIWYHGPSGADLLLWRREDGQLGRFAVFALGNFVQWEASEGLLTGLSSSAFEAVENRGALRYETLLVKRDSKPDATKLNIAKTLVLSSNIPEDIKNWCAKQLHL